MVALAVTNRYLNGRAFARTIQRVNVHASDFHSPVNVVNCEHKRDCVDLAFSMPNMTGRPGYRTRPGRWMEEVPRRTSLALLPSPCFVLCLIGVGTGELLDYQGRVGDHFHCAVEPSPGHIRCRHSRCEKQLWMNALKSCGNRAWTEKVNGGHEDPDLNEQQLLANTFLTMVAFAKQHLMWTIAWKL